MPPDPWLKISKTPFDPFLLRTYPPPHRTVNDVSRPFILLQVFSNLNFKRGLELNQMMDIGRKSRTIFLSALGELNSYNAETPTS
jgi:hypothetical protein